ncbi:MAG: YqeG family HAD IIIA-type phosphatase [Lachnospiraceae bacterium]|nr:YqeG family HAD IIIA-type phosphatase [Lachnospiraceae bacterium]
MLETFYPDEYVDSAYGIPYETLYSMGYRGIIFDVDNTLVPHGAPADRPAVELFEKLRELGFSTCILSNNREPRVAPFANRVKSPYIYKGGKPSVKGYRLAMEVMKTETSNTLFIGDQLFTDVWGARRTGLYSILVKPIDPKEEIQIVMKRYLEAVVLWFYKRRRKKTGSGSHDFCKK